MDVTPGSDPLAFTLALPDARTPHRSAQRFGVGRWWLRSALVGVVFALGLLQGSRAALGRMPLAPALEVSAHAEVPVAGELEADAIRGHFFRPKGSDAVRPVLRLRPSRWLPAEAKRVALTFPDPSPHFSPHRYCGGR
jgi:hypothetical protein